MSSATRLVVQSITLAAGDIVWWVTTPFDAALIRQSAIAFATRDSALLPTQYPSMGVEFDTKAEAFAEVTRLKETS